MKIESILPVPDFYEAKRILCVQPHYDDNDIAAGGVLGLLKLHGASLFYLTVTDDLMGVIDDRLSPQEAAAALKRDQFEAGQIIGVTEQRWLGFPDAGDYDYFTLRADILKSIRELQPDFVFAPDPWLPYEAHRDHIQTGLAVAEAVLFAGLKKIPSSDQAVDDSYTGHNIKGVAFYYTREPNVITDISKSWDDKISAVSCYRTQFTPDDMELLLMALDIKSRQVAGEKTFERGEPLKVLHPQALHCGI